jgi:aldehyde:ferredoxin oxidoreductase
MTRVDDWLPDRYFDESTPLGLPGVRGKRIDRDKFRALVDEYYQLHEWDEEGFPTPELLKRLDISDLGSSVSK